MDAPAPPQIIFELPAPCDDGVAADAALRDTLQSSVAPRPAYTVLVRVTRGPSGLVAEGEVTDPQGKRLAQRRLSSVTKECKSLTRALGVWAQLVLDAENDHVKSLPPLPPRVPNEPKPSPSRRRPEVPTNIDPGVDFGASGFAMIGSDAGIVSGLTGFAIVNATQGWFIRPAVSLGHSALYNQNDRPGFFGATRIDGCGRVVPHVTLRIDLCAGTEIDLQQYSALPLDPPGNSGDRSSIILSIGPAIALRARVAENVWLDLRTLGGVNVVKPLAPPLVHPSLFVGRAEVGLSFHLP